MGAMRGRRESNFDVIEEYRRPAVAGGFVRELQSALSKVGGVRAACLVERRVAIEGHDSGFRLGIAAQLKTRRFRDISQDLQTALRPFGLASDEPPECREGPIISWTSSGNSPIDEMIWAAAIPIALPEPRVRRGRRFWRRA